MSYRDVMDEVAPSAHPVYNAAPTQAVWAHNLLEANERVTKDLVFGRVPDAFRPPAGGLLSGLPITK